MSTSQTKIPKWVTIIVILMLIGFGAYLIFVLVDKPAKTQGCFDLSDGNLHGWTLDQLYDIDLNKSQIIKDGLHNKSHVKIPFEPFQFTNNAGALSASASSYQISDSTVNNCMFYFVSPDLSEKPEWQTISGFIFDITRNFTSTTGDWYAHNVFAEILVVNISGEEEILFENYIDPDKKSYLSIALLGIPYYFRCLPVELAKDNYNYTIKQLRIGCTVPGFNYNPNVQFSGSWDVTNICPFYD
jgi:hypothetical protein